MGCRPVPIGKTLFFFVLEVLLSFPPRKYSSGTLQLSRREGSEHKRQSKEAWGEGGECKDGWVPCKVRMYPGMEKRVPVTHHP